MEIRAHNKPVVSLAFAAASGRPLPQSHFVRNQLSAIATTKTSSQTPRHHALRCALPPLRNSSNIRVDSASGRTAPAASPTAVELEFGEIDLPLGTVPFLRTMSGATVSTERAARAFVVAPRGAWRAGADLDPSTLPLLFIHGFSQRAANYDTILAAAARSGRVVLAPAVWLLSVLAPWTSVETAPWYRLPQKLQTAQLIDAARCAAIVAPSAIHIAGHSMGGGNALVLAWAMRMPNDRRRLRSVITLAPAVSVAALTELNPLLSLQGDYEARLTQFSREFPDSAPLLGLHGDQDRIVSRDTTRTLLEFLSAGRDGNEPIADGELPLGTHVGFEDRLDVVFGPTSLRITLRVLFSVVDLIVYGPKDVLNLDTKEQLETTKKILSAWFRADEKGRQQFREMLQEIDPSVVWSWAPSLNSLVEAARVVTSANGENN